MEKKKVAVLRIGSRIFDAVSRLIIVGLCLYIITYSTENIFNISIVHEAQKAGKTIFNKICGISFKEKTTFMTYMENDQFTWDKYIENKIISNELKSIVEKPEKTSDEKNKEDETVAVNSTSEKKEQKNKTSEKQIEEKEKTKDERIFVQSPKITGVQYTSKKLKSFENTIGKFYTVASATSIKESDMKIDEALDLEFKIEGDGSKPQILIYHTHSQELFKENKKTKSIVQVGDYLAKILREQFGYNVIHDTSSYDLKDGKLDRNVAYDRARKGVSKILKENPSVNLVLDLHRDGVDNDTHLLCNVNEKNTAQIMFFNGMSRFKDEGEIAYLYNPYLKENLALSLQMKLNAEAYYPGFTRRNYLNAYNYNLDLCKKCMLIEIGAQTNTFEEAKNAAEPLAMLIHITMGK